MVNYPATIISVYYSIITQASLNTIQSKRNNSRNFKSHEVWTQAKKGRTLKNSNRTKINVNNRKMKQAHTHDNLAI